MTCDVGDFNAKLLNWWSSQSSDAHGVALSSLMCDHGLTQVVEGPTRLANLSTFQLDLMFIDNSALVNDCIVLPPVAGHCPSLLRLQLNVSRYSKRRASCSSWDFRHADLPSLNRFLEIVDWSPVYTTDASVAVSSWESILLSSMEKFIPSRNCVSSRQHNKPWFNSYLSLLRRKRNSLFCRSKLLDRDHQLYNAYRKLRNLYVAELRLAERQYYQKQISALKSSRLIHDPHRLWKTVKTVCGIQSSDSIPSL